MQLAVGLGRAHGNGSVVESRLLLALRGTCSLVLLALFDVLERRFGWRHLRLLIQIAVYDVLDVILQRFFHFGGL